MLADLCFTTDCSFFCFSSAALHARWTELNENWSHARKWVQFENACPKSGVFHALQIGGPKTNFFNDFATWWQL